MAFIDALGGRGVIRLSALSSTVCPIIIVATVSALTIQVVECASSLELMIL